MPRSGGRRSASRPRSRRTTDLGSASRKGARYRPAGDSPIDRDLGSEMRLQPGREGQASVWVHAPNRHTVPRLRGLTRPPEVPGGLDAGFEHADIRAFAFLVVLMR